MSENMMTRGQTVKERLIHTLGCHWDVPDDKPVVRATKGDTYAVLTWEDLRSLLWMLTRMEGLLDDLETGRGDRGAKIAHMRSLLNMR